MKNDNPTRAGLLLGPLLVLTALAVNPWSLAWFMTADEHIADPTARKAIFVGQSILLVLGCWAWIYARKATGADSRGPFASSWLARLVAGPLCYAILGMVTLLGLYGSLRVQGFLEPAEIRLQTEEISRMNASETLHLNLGSSRMKLLNRDLMNLQVPTGYGRQLFTEEVLVRDLATHSEPHLKHEFATVETRVDAWDLEPLERSVGRAELDFLRPFFDQVSFLESGKVYFIGGDFVGDDLSHWEVKAGFKAFGKRPDGSYVKGKGKLVLGWKLAPGKNPNSPEDFQDYGAWSICRVALKEFKTYSAPRLYFAEELDLAIDDRDALGAARRNLAQEQVVEALRARAEGQTWEPPHEHWAHQASWRNPSVSVVDLDRDGFDDFYLMARYGKNLFFRNRGNGTFEEIGADLGLDVEDHSGVAIFADFDNDGDDDVFLGRTAGRSLYLVNEGGRFLERNDLFGVEEMPFFASTASAVDYDQDGLLDLYVGTYAAQLVPKEMQRPETRRSQELLADYLEPAHARELYQEELAGRRHKIRDRVGPPNLLFRNTGGRFELVEDTPLLHYRNTFQATFADYDNDGDPDVYVANDFAPNAMFRNDAGRFVDVTGESNAADIGFGMGVSWGDYDRDGDQDAYVSNMFSKAGNRILPMVSAVDETFLRMAGGNSLLELEDGRFERVSSLEGPGLHVEYGGWSWGSLFWDFNNDAWLDLFALSGYYSAPKEIAAGHDL